MCKCKYCGKEFENPYKLGGHVSRCKQNPNYSKNCKKCCNWNKSKNNFPYKGQKKQCQYCGKEYGIYGLKTHEKYCNLNPNKSNYPTHKHIGHVSWNKGLTAKTDERVKRNGEAVSKHYETHDSFWKGRKHSEETKDKIRNTIEKNVDNGNWHNHFGIKIWYKDICFDSNWELEFAKYLDKKHINWTRPNKGFQYFINNEKHFYYPDFYLNDYDLYIEIKGLPIDKDYIKWEQFEHKLDIYDGEDLCKLGINAKYNSNSLIKEEYKRKHIDLNNL